MDRSVTHRSIFLCGVSCVGKSTIGSALADDIGFRFCDLDQACEKFFGKPVRRVRDSYATEYGYLRALAQVLAHELQQTNTVFALPPNGMLAPLWQIIKQTNRTVVELRDRPENIVKRLVWFDIDSNAKIVSLSEEDKLDCLEEIREEIAIYRRSYRRADFFVDLAGRDIAASVHLLRSFLGLM
jgi:shikimate kinase